MSGAEGCWEEKQKELYLKNKEGKCLNLLLRQYRQGDEPGMIACIRDEYGDTYFRSSYYQPENLRREAESGRIAFLLAEVLSGDKALRGEIAGMLTMKRSGPPENTCELASEIFRKKYRSYGLAMPFLEYAMELVKAGGYASVFGLSALFHDTTQRLLSRLGFQPCGFAFGILDMKRVSYSYQKDRNQKHPGGIQVMALEKQDAGTLYLPSELEELCRQTYDSLGVAYRIAAATLPCREPLPEKSGLTWKEDEGQGSLEIRLHRAGSDLLEHMERLCRRYPLRGRQTANIYLNVCDNNAVWAYRELEKRGFVFGGFHPLCGEREYLLMHHPGETKSCPRDYFLTEEMRVYMNAVLKFGNKIKDRK